MRIATLTVACSALTFAACGNHDSAPSACTTAAPSGGPAFVGTVTFAFSVESTGTGYNVDASLYPDFGQAALNASTNCPGTQLGGCCFMPSEQMCTLPAQASAGDMTVAKNSQAFGELTFSDGYYNDLDSADATSGTFSWQPGDTLSVSAAGASSMAESFTGSVVAPADLANLSPAISGSLTIPKANDLVITWTPGAGTAQAQFFFEDISLAGVTCSVPVTSGTVTVPAALLEMLGSSGSVVAGTVASAAASGSDAAVYLRAYGTPLFAQASYPAH